MVKSIPIVSIRRASSLLATCFLVGGISAIAMPTSAFAQFGGTQDMMLEKQRRQQQAVTDAGNRPRGVWQSQNQAPSHPGHQYPHRPGNTYNIYPSYPIYRPIYPSYGYSPYDPYGYGFGGFPQRPIIYPPNITVVPHGVPLTSGMLNGAYSVPINPYLPYGGYGNAPVVPTVPFDQPQPPVVLARPAMPNANANPNANPNANVPPPAPAQPFDPENTEDEIRRRVAALKPSTEAGRLRSDELIAAGDKEFAAQEYRRAASKYREAIAKAPDYPPSHLRAGHAYIATGDYELAVTYLAMGFELSRTIKQPGFSLADLYRGNALAQEQHHEALADAVLRQPQDGGLLFLTGITQHYSGRPLQARDYFRRASEIPGRHQAYAAMFLPAPNEKANAK